MKYVTEKRKEELNQVLKEFGVAKFVVEVKRIIDLGVEAYKNEDHSPEMKEIMEITATEMKMELDRSIP